MVFYENLKSFKKKIALVHNDQTISYEKLLNNSKIISKKIEKKSLVFLLIDNDFESISSIIATEFSNSVAMLLNFNINSEMLQNLIKAYNPDYLFFKKKNKLKLISFETRLNFYDYTLLKNKNSFKKKINSDLFILQSTSGSTGSPKNVRISYENLITNTNSIISDLNIQENDVAITTLPINYVYGLSIINTHLKAGAKIVLNKNSVFESQFWKRLIATECNNFGGVPFTYEILTKIGLKEEYFKYIKYSTVAGGHLKKEIKLKILDFYEKNNISLICMYGAAEATARMSYLPYSFSREKIDSIGIPIEGGSFYIENVNEPFKHGELIYKGNNVCMGYSHTYKDLNKKNNNNYVLNTGDIAYFDKDNFYYIKGKKSRYIKLAGNRISLDEIENIISQFGIENICSQGSNDEMVIFIKRKINEKNLKSYLSNYVKLNEKLFKIKYLKEFPMTENNKIDYNNEILKIND